MLCIDEFKSLLTTITFDGSACLDEIYWSSSNGNSLSLSCSASAGRRIVQLWNIKLYKSF